MLLYPIISYQLQDSMHRSHDGSTESPYSQYNASPAAAAAVAPRSAGAAIRSSSNRKRSLPNSEEKEKAVPLYKSSRVDKAAAGSASGVKATGNSLYLSDNSGNLSDELDSMQYSAQPTRPLRAGAAGKSGAVLPFKVYED
jgi:hypothetical protein